MHLEATSEEPIELGQPLSGHSDAIGPQMQHLKASISELRQRLCLHHVNCELHDMTNDFLLKTGILSASDAVGHMRDTYNSNLKVQ